MCELIQFIKSLTLFFSQINNKIYYTKFKDLDLTYGKKKIVSYLNILMIIMSNYYKVNVIYIYIYI